MSDTNDKPQEMPDAPSSPASQPAQPMQPSHPPGQDLRRRLRELLSVPESQRSDAVWDEIIELEIQLAPGNRVGGAPTQKQNERLGGPRGPGGGGGGPGAPGGGNWKRHPAGRKHPKPGPKKPPGSGGAPPAG